MSSLFHTLAHLHATNSVTQDYQTEEITHLVMLPIKHQISLFLCPGFWRRHDFLRKVGIAEWFGDVVTYCWPGGGGESLYADWHFSPYVHEAFRTSRYSL